MFQKTDGVQRTAITLERIGRMPMPIDLSVEYTDGTKESVLHSLAHDEF
jgi:hypothetical protein